MIEAEDKWKAGDRVDSVGGTFRDGEVLEVRKENTMAILKIKWPNGLIQERSDRIVRKI